MSGDPVTLARLSAPEQLLEELVAAERQLARVRSQREDAVRMLADADGRLAAAHEWVERAKAAINRHVARAIADQT